MASFKDGQLHMASFKDGQLHMVSVKHGQLHIAFFKDGQLHMASFKDGQLHMASFKESFLQITLFGPHFDNDPFADRPIFIDDNTIPHRARVVRECRQPKTTYTFQVSALSPDMNPIEYLWDFVEPT